MYIKRIRRTRRFKLTSSILKCFRPLPHETTEHATEPKWNANQFGDDETRGTEIEMTSQFEILIERVPALNGLKFGNDGVEPIEVVDATMDYIQTLQNQISYFDDMDKEKLYIFIFTE
ncbi:unnamed protein product [Caenorhabditis sp. 36 PRJEB53466]|nr:unnamed protein product [Caenorhabditis sp. 36 PRJEB53466]